MDFARQQRDPTRHLVGITFVVLLHALIVYALVSGLARKAVEVIKKPIDAKIIEEIKAPPPPPPPPKPVQQQPQRVEVAPQPYIPPPDIEVPTTPQTAPTISAVTTEAPTQPYVIAPPPPVAVAPPPPAPKPAVRRGIARVSGEDPVYPREAIKAGVAKGHVVVRLQIDEKGNVIDIKLVTADPPRVFDRVVAAAVKDWKFLAEGEKYVAEVEFNFTLKDE
ncbi:MAG: energy transducer TonB [Betaproteobacteria bacterium]|nr:energy transducer TonB [Betaproteobacteria bacterium]MBK7744824.1 energy transducer TonB [Betaproteobacteria bacterium]